MKFKTLTASLLAVACGVGVAVSYPDLPFNALATSLFSGDNSTSDGTSSMNSIEDYVGSLGSLESTEDSSSEGYFKVSFESNGGSTVSEVEVLGDTLLTKPENPTWLGYVFLDWYEDEDLSIVWDFSETLVSESMTLYAKWEMEKNFTVKFDTNGGSSLSSQVVASYELAEEPTTPTRSGYIFAGWYGDKDLEEVWDFETNIITENTTIYAKWTQIITSTTAGTIVNAYYQPVNEAEVSFYRNGAMMFEGTTNDEGVFYFYNVPTGVYNIKVEVDGKTFISSVSVEHTSGYQEIGTVIMPLDNVSSVLNISSSTYVSVVKNFDLVSAVLGSDVATGEGAVVQLNVSAYASEDSKEAIVAYKATDEIVAQYFQLNMSKSIVDTLVPTTEKVEISDYLVELVIELPTAYQGMDDYMIYREVDGGVQAITTKSNVYGEHFVVSSDKKTISLYTCHYSTFALVYSDSDVYSEDSTHPIKVEKVINEVYTTNPSVGSVGLSESAPTYGTTVVVIPYANAGFKVDYVTAVEKSGTALTVSANSDGTYQFKQKQENVTVTVAFVTTMQADYSSVPVTLFTDVNVYDSFCEAVTKVVNTGLMSGTGNSRFSPHENMTRGYLASILYNLSGDIGMYAYSGFSDVSTSDYFNAAVSWASANHIMTGNEDGQFRPYDTLTREEFAVVLYSFAEKYTNMTSLVYMVPVESRDVATVSGWAKQAVSWAVTTDMMEERYNQFFLPKAMTTRSDVAIAVAQFLKVMN